MEQPNILLITTDQQRFDHLCDAGLTGISTPNLDRLATEGVRMERAYCPSPICTPTRLSLLTGLYPSSHGGYSIGVSPDPFPNRTIPGELSSSGYRTGIIGKTHFVARPDEVSHMVGDQAQDSNPFRSWTGPYAGFDYIQASTGHTVNHIPEMHYRVFLEDAGVDYKPWFPQMSPGYDHLFCGPWNIPEEYHDTHWVAERSMDFFKKSKGQPWFCWSSFQDPHEPHVCPEPWYSSVDTSNMPEYEGLRPGEFDQKPEIYEKLYNRDIKDIDDGHGVPCTGGNPRLDEQKSKAMQATLGMIAFLDAKLGDMIACLEESGQLDNTIIIFTSDHGELHGHHGLWGKGLAAYDDCQRVPLLIWGPKYFSRRGKQSALVSLVDLPATVLSLAGVSGYPHQQGVDLMPYLREETEQTQDGVLIECRANQKILNQVTLVTDTHKLILTQPFALGELYDLTKDPDQYNNLWNEPDLQTIKTQLLEQLARKRMRSEPQFSTRKTFG